MSAHRKEAAPLVGIGILERQPRRDGLRFGFGLPHGAARPQQAHHGERVVVARITCGGRFRERRPQVGDHGEYELFRHHADYAVVFVVDADIAADDGGIGGEAAAPERVAQNRHVLVPGLVFLRREGAAQRRLGAHQRKEIGRHQVARGALRRGAVARQVAQSVVPGGDALEDGLLLPDVGEVGRGDRLPLVRIAGDPLQHNRQPAQIGQRQGLPQHGIADAEIGRSGADPQGQSGDGGQRKTRRFAQRARAIADVLPELHRLLPVQLRCHR